MLSDVCFALITYAFQQVKTMTTVILVHHFLQIWCPTTLNTTILNYGGYTSRHTHIIWADREKICLRGFWQSDIQTNLLSCRDELENWNVARSTSRYYTFQ